MGLSVLRGILLYDAHSAGHLALRRNLAQPHWGTIWSFFRHNFRERLAWGPVRCSTGRTVARGSALAGQRQTGFAT